VVVGVCSAGTTGAGGVVVLSAVAAGGAVAVAGAAWAAATSSALGGEVVADGVGVWAAAEVINNPRTPDETRVKVELFI
jgi:hypothetical protein